MDIVKLVREAGVVGAGGAGFPTHVKINCSAGLVIANGAECEPLLRVDQQVMACYAAELVEGLRAVMAATGAKESVICLKSHYKDAVAALTEQVKDMPDIRLHTMKSYYPAGDEQTMVYEVTGRVVPTGGLPLDVGVVVCNVSTLVNVRESLRGAPVTDKFVTVGGQVQKPVTLKAPVGTPIRRLVEEAGGPADLKQFIYILGGPCMGAVTEDWDAPVTKTTGGVLVFHKTHGIVSKKGQFSRQDNKLIKGVCCQCSLCTQLCPRNALGLHVEPHKAMRAIASGNGELLGECNGIFSCCDCGVCTYYACNFGLKPASVMTLFKENLRQKGVKPKKEVYGRPDGGILTKRVPVKRLIGRLGISAYDVPAPLVPEPLDVREVAIPLKMCVGSAAKPVVKGGQRVRRGELIADVEEGVLGAKVHASIDGTVLSVTEEQVRIGK